MKTKLIQIGNSRGIRLPKPVIEQAGLTDEVELSVRHGEIIVQSIRRPRSGWMKAAEELHHRGEDTLHDTYGPTHFDEEEWQW